MRALIAAVIFTLALAASARSAPARCISPAKPPRVFEAFVFRVVDGDTVDTRLKAGPRERVRLLGIDTPEVHDSPKLERDAAGSGQSRDEIRRLGELAADFTRRHLDGRNVGLELDVQTRDQYGRLLAYVWLHRTMFNVSILKEGYAQVLTIPPNVRYVEIFLACQREARAQRRGLWGK